MKKKNLLTTFLALTALIAGITVSCQKEERIYLSREAANRAAIEYLHLNGDQYVLTLSSSKAAELNISDADYLQMQREVQETNAKIRELQLQTKSNGSALELPDPQALLADVNYKPSRLKSINPDVWDDLNGVITTTDQSPGSKYMFVPAGYNNLHCETYSTALVGFNTITVYSGGNVIAEQTISFSVWGGSCDIALPLSNTNITVQFRTASSGGGSCAYSLQKK